MLLAADIGNSNITLGIYASDLLLATLRVPTESAADELFDAVLRFLRDNGAKADAAAVASVVPSATLAFSTCIKEALNIEPFIINCNTKTGISIKTEHPEKVGADRLVNASAAYHFYGGPVMVIDFGTATTYDVVSYNGEFLGGAIAPGIGISAEALWGKTAKLPRVDISKPEKVLGTDTKSSMLSGIFYGYLGQVEYLTRKLREETGFDMKTIATGGLSHIFKSHMTFVDIFDDDLTLNGINFLYQSNH